MDSPAEPDVQPTCTDFVLDEAQVRQFLRHADGVDQCDYMHTLDWSPCHARGGRVSFVRGAGLAHAAGSDPAAQGPPRQSRSGAPSGKYER